MPLFDGDRPWKEVYIVSPEVAGELVELLESEQYFGWPSMPDSAMSDGITWDLIVKADKKRHRALVSIDCDFSFEGFREIESNRFEPGNSKIKRHVAMYFELIRRLRNVASEKGRLVTNE